MDGKLLQIAVSSLIWCDSTQLRLLAQIDETGLILLTSLIVYDMTGSSPDICPQSEFPEAGEEFKHSHSSCVLRGRQDDQCVVSGRNLSFGIPLCRI